MSIRNRENPPQDAEHHSDPVKPGDTVTVNWSTNPRAHSGTVEAVSPCGRFVWVKWSDGREFPYNTYEAAELVLWDGE